MIAAWLLLTVGFLVALLYAGLAGKSSIVLYALGIFAGIALLSAVVGTALALTQSFRDVRQGRKRRSRH